MIAIGDDVYHPGRSSTLIGRVTAIQIYSEVTLVQVKNSRGDEYLIPESELKKLGESTNDAKP